MVYIETTVISYLTSRPSRDLVVAGHQQTTHDWWNKRRGSYELCVSFLVLQEAAAGDPEIAKERLALVSEAILLDTTPTALELARELLRVKALPPKAKDDAVHIAVAATQGVSYLLTWNCRHMANATMRRVIEAACAARGYRPPIICTPLELMEPRR